MWNLPSTRTSCLKQLRGGPYWAWESGRRHSRRAGAQGLLVSGESRLLEGKRCHHHLRPWSQDSKGPHPVQFWVGSGRQRLPSGQPVEPEAPALSLWGRFVLPPSPGPGGACSQGLGEAHRLREAGGLWQASGAAGDMTCACPTFVLCSQNSQFWGNSDLPSRTAL